MKATDLLRDDHREVEERFHKIETGNTGPDTYEDLVGEVIRLLSIHAAIEEHLLYPVAREAMPAMEADVLEDLEEHHVAKVLLSELDGMDRGDDRFLPKVNVLMENVRHHVRSEEDELFPALEDALEDDELEDLGERLERSKGIAPTRPHPSAPDAPPGNLVDLGAAVVDRVRDRLASVRS